MSEKDLPLRLLKRFLELENLLEKKTSLKLQKIAPYLFLLSSSKKVQRKNEGEKLIDLSFFAAVHGNEIGGIAVLNSILEEILSADLSFVGTLAFGIGNPEAVKKNVRFTARDLNRSFGLKEKIDVYEAKRASELEKVLSKTHRFLDLHQTIQASLEPFFIFPYTKESFLFAYHLNKELTIITHKGGFSKAGLCSDEFVHSFSGMGITLETGQCGLEEKQVDLGSKLIKEAISFYATDKQAKSNGSSLASHPSLYTWAHIEPYPEFGEVKLREGLVNFLQLKKGELIGVHDGKELFAPMAGKVLFPKYLSLSEQERTRPKELYRLLKKVDKEFF